MQRARNAAARDTTHRKSGESKQKQRVWRTAFAIFMSETLLKMKAERGKVIFGEASKEISAKWKAMTEEERKPYQLIEEEEKVLYPKVKTEKQLQRERERALKLQQKAASKAEREARRAAERERKQQEAAARKELRAALALEKKEE